MPPLQMKVQRDITLHPIHIKSSIVDSRKNYLWLLCSIVSV